MLFVVLFGEFIQLSEVRFTDFNAKFFQLGYNFFSITVRYIYCERRHGVVSAINKNNTFNWTFLRHYLTNAFSKKMENHCYAIALHFVYYNFAKIHKTIRVTPAMEAGLTKDVMTIEEIVRLAD
jgi:hypothetical protein